MEQLGISIRDALDSGARLGQLKAALAASDGPDGAALAALLNLEQDPGSVSRLRELQRCLDGRPAGANAVLAALLPRQRSLAMGLAPAPPAPCAIAAIDFATDRQPSGASEPALRFGAERGQLCYGSCEVSIPRDHRMGALESPTLLRFEMRASPARHVILQGLELTPGLPADRDDADAALLFVHGYNTSFEDAARRTGQLSYDLGFNGGATLYSWPSQGRLAAYWRDEANCEWSAANLRAFLQDYFARHRRRQVFLVAHSMGARLLTAALAGLLAQPAPRLPARAQLILSAPDIDSAVFRRDLAPLLAGPFGPLTLYASSADLALSASQKLHGYPRAGDSGAGLLVLPGMETIDASGVDTGFIGHSYFAEQRTLLSDLFYLVRQNARASQRFGLSEVSGPAGRYWRFRL